MNSRIQILGTLVISFLCSALLGQSFEGTIAMQRQSANENTAQEEVIFTIKQDHILIALESEKGPVRVIKDLDAGTTTSLFQNGQKKYAFTVYEEGSVAKDVDPRHTMLMEVLKNQVKFEVTSEQRQIGDFVCTKVLAENHQVQIEAWISESVDVSLVDYFPYQQTDAAAALDIQKLIWETGFVVEFWSKNKKTQEVDKLTFTPVRSKVDDNVFAYDPSEYTQYDKNALTTLYEQASTDPNKMDELKEVLEAFQGK